jgi:hypothetical protein
MKGTRMGHTQARSDSPVPSGFRTCTRVSVSELVSCGHGFCTTDF